MNGFLLYPYGFGNALPYACRRLRKLGYKLTDHPTPEITHLLTDVPCKEESFRILQSLPEDVTIIGGALPHSITGHCKTIDLLRNEEYLCRNADITAQCALTLGQENGQITYHGANILIIGWGRIGKHLAKYAKCLGANVTIALRNPKEAALAESMGYHTVAIPEISPDGYDLIFNTVPHPILSLTAGKNSPIAIDLASSPGITGDGVITARGLPGKMACKSSGLLIAGQINKILKECAP